MEKQINDIIFQLRSFQFENIEDALDFLFDTLDDKLINKEFIFCNKFLKTVNVENFTANLLVGMLTITYQFRIKLTSRPDFFQRVKIKIENEYNENESKQILNGLQ